MRRSAEPKRLLNPRDLDLVQLKTSRAGVFGSVLGIGGVGIPNTESRWTKNRSATRRGVATIWPAEGSSGLAAWRRRCAATGGAGGRGRAAYRARYCAGCRVSLPGYAPSIAASRPAVRGRAAGVTFPQPLDRILDGGPRLGGPSGPPDPRQQTSPSNYRRSLG